MYSYRLKTNIFQTPDLLPLVFFHEVLLSNALLVGHSEVNGTKHASVSNYMYHLHIRDDIYNSDGVNSYGVPIFQKLSIVKIAVLDDVIKFNGHETMHHLERLQQDVHDQR